MFAIYILNGNKYKYVYFILLHTKPFQAINGWSGNEEKKMGLSHFAYIWWSNKMRRDLSISKLNKCAVINVCCAHTRTCHTFTCYWNVSVAHMEFLKCVLSYNNYVLKQKLILIYEFYLFWNFQKYISVWNWNMDKSKKFISDRNN